MDNSKKKSQETIPEFDSTEVFKRIAYVLGQKIASIQEEHRRRGDRLSQEEIITGYRRDGKPAGVERFPVSKHAYRNYKTSGDKINQSRANSLRVDTLYDICRYTGVSADYLLGFIDTPRKEQSAEMVRQEFGLSDESMKFLKEAHERSPASRGEVTSSLVNIILGDSRFWYEMNLILPMYISSKNHEYRTDDRLEFMTKYSLIQNFDALLNAIDKGINEQDKTPVAEPDETDPYFMTI